MTKIRMDICFVCFAHVPGGSKAQEGDGTLFVLHRQERLRDPVNLLTRAIFHHLANGSWPDLPGKSKFVFQPATLFSLWIGRKLLPVVIDFFLRFTGHKKRDGFVEHKMMCTCAIHSAKLRAFQGESNVLYGSFFVRLFSLAVALEKEYFRVMKYRCVKSDRFFCFSADRSNKHEHRRYCLLYVIGACVNNLPRQAVFIFYPAISFAEGIGIKWHQNVPAERELFPYRIDLLFCLQLDMK